LKVASVGARLSEGPDPEDKDAVIEKYQMPLPIPLVTFALGPYERHPDTIKGKRRNVATEFNSISGDERAIKEDFILAEMNNSVRYFTTLFAIIRIQVSRVPFTLLTLVKASFVAHDSGGPRQQTCISSSLTKQHISGGEECGGAPIVTSG
jgi:hypothetical protein